MQTARDVVLGVLDREMAGCREWHRHFMEDLTSAIRRSASDLDADDAQGIEDEAGRECRSWQSARSFGGTAQDVWDRISAALDDWRRYHAVAVRAGTADLFEG